MLFQSSRPNKGLLMITKVHWQDLCKHGISISIFACHWHFIFSSLADKIDLRIEFKTILFTREFSNIEILPPMSITNFILLASSYATTSTSGGSVRPNAVCPIICWIPWIWLLLFITSILNVNKKFRKSITTIFLLHYFILLYIHYELSDSWCLHNGYKNCN